MAVEIKDSNYEELLATGKPLVGRNEEQQKKFNEGRMRIIH